MAMVAAACGILFIAAGLWSMGGHADGVGVLTVIVCLVGGLVLCFLAALLSRVAALGRRLDDLDERSPERVPVAPSQSRY